MATTGWFDKFTNTEIERNVESGVVSYKKIIKSPATFTYGGEPVTQVETKSADILEVFKQTLVSAKKNMTPELKQIIDDLLPNNINTPYGITTYDTKTPLGYAIDDSNVPAVEYLLEQGANPNISGPNQKHILQELLGSNATEKRVIILEMILPKLNPRTIKLEKNYNDNYYTMKYLVPLVNSGHFSETELQEAFLTMKPKEKKTLVEQCEKMIPIALGNGDEELLPSDIKDLFLF